MTTEVTLRVPETYTLPPFFKTEDPDLIATVLDVAARLPGFLGEQAGCLDVRKSVRAALSEWNAEESKQERQHMERLLEQRDAQIAELRTAKERAECERDVLQRTTQDRIDACCADAQRKAKVDVQVEIDSVWNLLHDAKQSKIASEQALCDARKDHCRIVEEHSQRVLALQERIHELETPMGRGTVGEVDVAQCLRDMGFVVEDTSTGDAKNEGYLDLLVYPDAPGEGGPRIAVEVKNRKEVKRENITAFEEHVRHGLKRGLFDSAVFVSIRAHVKRDAAAALDMYDDDGERPIVPVSWIGPERGKHVPPLTADQLEAHMTMHCAVLSKARHLREVFAKHAVAQTEEDRQRVQLLVDHMVSDLNHLFADFGRHATLLEGVRANLTDMRARAITMFLHVHSVNRSVSWLGRSVTNRWLATFENARRKVGTHTDAQIWNQCADAKATIEKTIGKEAMFKVLRQE